MGWRFPPLYGNKPSEFYKKKIQKAEKIIKKQNEIINACKEELAKIQAKN